MICTAENSSENQFLSTSNFILVNTWSGDSASIGIKSSEFGLDSPGFFGIVSFQNFLCFATDVKRSFAQFPPSFSYCGKPTYSHKWILK